MRCIKWFSIYGIFTPLLLSNLRKTDNSFLPNKPYHILHNWAHILCFSSVCRYSHIIFNHVEYSFRYTIYKRRNVDVS